ncbi:MAG: hypothetical protein RR436_07155 [Clostridia bacterium]
METYEVTVKMTFKDKIVNFWYHYKWQTLLVLFIAMVLSVSVVSCVNKPHPDLTIVFVSQNALLDKQRLELKEVMASKISDYNEDGKSLVEIIEIDLLKTNDTIRSAGVQRLMAELVVAENYFFMIDDEGYRVLNENKALSDISTLVPNTIMDNKVLDIPTDKLFFTVSSTMPKSYYATIRIYSDDLDKAQQKSLAASKELLINFAK